MRDATLEWTDVVTSGAGSVRVASVPMCVKRKIARKRASGSAIGRPRGARWTGRPRSAVRKRTVEARNAIRFMLPIDRSPHTYSKAYYTASPPG